MLDDELPTPKAQPRARSRQSGTAAVLTSSPFKRILEEAEEKKSKKKTKKAVGVHKTNQASKVKNQSKQLRPPTKRKKQLEPDVCRPDDRTYACIYCSEPYQEPPTEDWLKCTGCDEWYHEKCGNGDERCDLCLQ
jgi:hypothetical protein